MNTLSTINNPLGGTPVEGQGRRAEAGGGQDVRTATPRGKAPAPALTGAAECFW